MQLPQQRRLRMPAWYDATAARSPITVTPHAQPVNKIIQTLAPLQIAWHSPLGSSLNPITGSRLDGVPLSAFGDCGNHQHKQGYFAGLHVIGVIRPSCNLGSKRISLIAVDAKIRKEISWVREHALSSIPPKLTGTSARCGRQYLPVQSRPPQALNRPDCK
jgi:hypothetical protein